MNTFQVCSICPGSLSHPGIAIATARAGEIGLLDFECLQQTAKAKCLCNLRQLLDRSKPESIVGIRISAEQIPEFEEILKLLEGRSHWVILACWNRRDLTD